MRWCRPAPKRDARKWRRSWPISSCVSVVAAKRASKDDITRLLDKRSRPFVSVVRAIRTDRSWISRRSCACFLARASALRKRARAYDVRDRLRTALGRLGLGAGLDRTRRLLGAFRGGSHFGRLALLGACLGLLRARLAQSLRFGIGCCGALLGRHVLWPRRLGRRRARHGAEQLVPAGHVVCKCSLCWRARCGTRRPL